MRKPTVHVNGTDAQTLFDNYYNALRKVKDAIKALNECAPNGRDYYLQRHMPENLGDPIGEAIDEHRQRLVALGNIERELQALAEHVQSEGEK
jgi:hypothetical protein